MLAVNRIEFRNVAIESPEALAELRASNKLPFDQMPLLEIDDLCLSQSSAMVRYLARRGDLYGVTENEALWCDMIAAATDDFCETAKQAAFQADDVQMRDGLQVRFNKFGPRFEARLKSVGTGYCAGKQLTFADVVLAEALTEYVERMPELLSNSPMLAELRQRVVNHSGIAAYLSSSERYPLADDNYVISAARVLQRALPGHMPEPDRFVLRP
jgi:glutathione S-transferase